MKRHAAFILLLSFTLATGCNSPAHGPDKTLAGTALGGAWGAGAGAVIGNQVSHAASGTAVGAGFGAVAGALTGAGYDMIESDIKQQELDIASLKAQNEANSRDLMRVQTMLDRLASSPGGFGVFQVFFDIDATNLKVGSIANLEVIAESLKDNPRATQIVVVGNADDSGSPEYNQQLSEARAREVTSYLMRRGISRDQIRVKSMGSTSPIASNTSPAGRQLNRRVDIYLGREQSPVISTP